MRSNQLPDESVKRQLSVVTYSRQVVRLVCLIAAVLCLLPVKQQYALIAIVPALSPYVAISSILALKTFNPIMLPGLVAGVLAFFKHRLFCRWICPLGTCLDCSGYIGRRLNRKPYQSIFIGQWLLIITLGGAVIGMPLFSWLDPLSLFAGMFILVENQTIAASISVIMVILLLILSLVSPEIWCRGICPLGGLQDMLAVINRSIKKRRLKTSDDKNSSAYPVARRTVIGLVFGIASGFIIRMAAGKSSGCLRPPGSAGELDFKFLCTRCGSCVRGCPTKIISRKTQPQTFTDILTPVISFDNNYCREDCVLCTHLCPSGAISSLTLDEKKHIRIGLPTVDMNICLLAEDRECSACRRFCPYGAVRYVFSEESYSLAPVIDPEKCNGCGACQVACPTKPVKAIEICPVDAET